MTRGRGGAAERDAGPGARSVALEVLHRVERHDAFAAAALGGELGRARLEGRDARFATELVFGVLRWRAAIDAALAPICDRPLDRLDARVRAILRLGAYELLGPLGTPPHAAVGEAVAVARRLRGRRPAGYVNAVLRRVAERGGELDLALALPPWLRRTFEREMGVAATRELSRWSVTQPPTGLRFEPKRGWDRERLREALLDSAPGDRASATLGRWSPLALVTQGLGPLSRHELFRRGLFTVQDEGAQVCAQMLDVVAGHRVLDACAGRGGKTSWFALAGRGLARIDAVDRHPSKLDRLREELDRLGRRGVNTVAVDLERGPGPLAAGYDRIMLDAPCSGTGTLARRPEIRWKLAEENLAGLVATQARLLERCLSLLGEAGALVYCVCSMLDAEGPDLVRSVVGRDGGASFRLVYERRLLPHVHGTDGFYVARIVRLDKPRGGV